MSDSLRGFFSRQSAQLGEIVSWPGEPRFIAATSIWAKQADVAPRAVVHCETAAHVQATIRIAQERGLPLSVRGGGHDWAGRAL